MIMSELGQGMKRRSARDIAGSVDLSTRQVQRILRRLETLGAIRVQRTPGDANRYRVAL